MLSAIVKNDREACSLSPSPKMVELAVLTMICASSKDAVKAMNNGQLQGLGASASRGVVWILARVRGEKMAELLGVSTLPVLMGSEVLAGSILRKAHQQDHRRNPRDIAARSWRLAWIVGAGRYAKRVASHCYQCRLLDKKMAKQLMGQLLDERTSTLSPFEATALDLFGPFQVKDVAKGRRSFSCWVVAYVCMSIKAVSLLPCPGYDTEVFLTTHRHFTGIYGQPRVVYTDHAPSLIKASRSYDWGEIADAVRAGGSEWRLTAKGCSWQNGLSERVVRSARHTMASELRKGDLLDFHQFGAVLAVSASIINSRPLSLRSTSGGEFITISPRDILLGRANKTHSLLDAQLHEAWSMEDDQRLSSMEDTQSRIVTQWRKNWLAAVFPDMVPRTKWKVSQRNVRVGDLGHLHYEEKLGAQTWRMARVVAVKTGEDNLVRTITVNFRPRHKSNFGKDYVSKPADEMEIGVQRFAVLLPVEEQEDCSASVTDIGLCPQASEMT